MSGRIGALRRWALDVEAAWLGWTFVPPRTALAASGWRPDSPRRYCGRCGGTAGPGERRRDGCAACRGRAPGPDGVVRLGPYDGQLGEWIRAVKYRRWAEMADELGRRLGRAAARRLRAEAADPASVVVVPMPMPWQRRLYRGIDHARVLATAAAGKLSAPVVPLLRRANCAPQVSLAAGPRAGRLLGLRLARCPSLEGLTVVLVDDVRTSGATLRAAARLLRRLGPHRLLAAVVAVADGPGRGPAAQPRRRGRSAPEAREGPGRPRDAAAAPPSPGASGSPP